MTNLDIEGHPEPERRGAQNRRRGFSNDSTGTLRKLITVPNALLLFIALFQAGNLWERNQNTATHLSDKINAVEVRLLAAEVAANSDAINNQHVYMRRDVIEERLRAMEQRLANIESALSIRGRR